MPRLAPFFSYFGSKYRKALRYPEPKYGSIVEPFAGSAGYSTRYYDRNVYLCDLNEEVCGVWDFLIHATKTDILRIPVDVNHVDELPDWCGQEVKWLVGWMFARVSAHPRLARSSWATPGHAQYETMKRTFWTPEGRERLASQVDYISHWKIKHGTYAELETRFPATWFVDPPYQEMGKHYRHSTLNFNHLSSWCQSLEGQVMVCERSDATWLPFRHFYTSSTLARSGVSGETEEAIWTNDRHTTDIQDTA